MRVGDAVAMASRFVNAWSGTYLDWHKHHVSWHRRENTRNNTILIISLVQVENHRCIHTIIWFVNTAGGISILAILVNHIIDIFIQICNIIIFFHHQKMYYILGIIGVNYWTLILSMNITSFWIWSMDNTIISDQDSCLMCNCSLQACL